MIEVRRVRREDEEAWRALWRDYLGFYETVLPEEVYRTSFARLIDPGVVDYNGLLATVDGAPAGLAHMILHRHGWRIEPVCYLQDLFVAPGHRGSGIGASLIEGVYAAADAAGCGEVYWLTQAHNATARRLYDRVGVETPFLKYRRRAEA